MVTLKEEVKCIYQWYLDSSCLTHMMGRKDWFVIINRAMKNKVKFTNDTTLAAEGISDVSIERMDGGNSLIKDVLYIPEINCNLLSIGQLHENDYKFHMKNKMLRVMDANMVLVLKAPMAPKRTFKVKLKVMEHRGPTTTIST